MIRWWWDMKLSCRARKGLSRIDEKIIARWIKLTWSITIWGQKMFSADFVFLNWSPSTSRLLGCFRSRVDEVFPNLFISCWKVFYIYVKFKMKISLLSHCCNNLVDRSWRMFYCFSFSSLSLFALFSQSFPCCKQAGREEGCGSCLNDKNIWYKYLINNSHPNVERKCWAPLPKVKE